MGIKRVKLSKKTQLRQLEFLVLEIMTRSFANILDLQANTAAFFYRKARELTAERTAADEKLLGGEVEADSSYFGGVRKGKWSAPTRGSDLNVNEWLAVGLLE